MSAAFADPRVCPNCRATLAAQQRCWNCHIDLSAPVGAQIWQFMTRYDQLLAPLRAEASAWRAQHSLPAFDYIDVSGRAQYADAQLCPACRTALHGAARCPACSLNMAGQGLGELWSLLQQIDQAMAVLRRTVAVASQGQVPDQSQGPAPAPSERRGINVGSLILALGALCIIVAAFIFITVSWESMSLATRTLTLTATTLIFGGLAVGATLRRLRGSAEALWWVFFGLLIFDVFAAGAEGMLGLDRLSGPNHATIFGILLTAIALLVAIWTRDPMGRNVVAAQVSMVVGVAIAAFGPDISDRFVWNAVLGFAITAAMTGGIAVARQRIAALFAAIVAALSYVVAQASVLEHVFSRPNLHQMWVGGSGYPLLVLIAVFVLLTAWALRNTRPLATVGGTIIGGNVLLAIYPPVIDSAAPDVAMLFLFAVALALAVAGVVTSGPVALATRCTAAASLLVPGLLLLWWLFVVGIALTPDAGQIWNRDVDVRFANPEVDSFAAWAPPLAILLALPVPFAIAGWWTKWRGSIQRLLPRALAEWAMPYVIAMLVFAAFTGAIWAQLPILAMCGLLLAIALVLIITAQDSAKHYGGAILAIIAACLIPAESQLASGLAWVLAAAVLSLTVFTASKPNLRAGAALGAAVVGVFGALTLVNAAGIPGHITRAIAIAVFIAITVFAGLREGKVALGSQITGMALTGFTLLTAVGDGSAWQCLDWAIAGAGLVGLGLLKPGQRWNFWPGGFAFAISYLFLLATGNIESVEAYSMPIAALLLAIGNSAYRQHPQWSTLLAFGPGLAVGFVPSLVLALRDTASLRGLIVGIVAIIAVLIGVRKSLAAPFWFGLISAGMIVAWSIWPYAHAVPRWAIIGVAGIALLAIGATFESRVKNAKSAIRYLGDLR